MKTRSLTLLAFSSAVAVLAGPRASTEYTITAKSDDAGGARATSTSYVVKTSPDLSPASWTTLVGGSVDNNGSQRIVTDTSASEPQKFDKVEIVKP